MRRLAAGFLEYGLVVGWLAVLSVFGFALLQLKLLPTTLPESVAARMTGQLVVFLLLGLPVALTFARWETTRGAGPGKRLLDLEVVTTAGERVPFGRSFLRNALRVLLPWELAHTAVWLTWGGRDSAATIPLLAACYLVVGAHLAMLLLTSRPLYDRLAGTIVRRTT